MNNVRRVALEVTFPQVSPAEGLRTAAFQSVPDVMGKVFGVCLPMDCYSQDRWNNKYYSTYLQSYLSLFDVDGVKFIYNLPFALFMYAVGISYSPGCADKNGLYFEPRYIDFESSYVSVNPVNIVNSAQDGPVVFEFLTIVD